MAIDENKKIKVCFISVFAYPLFNPVFKDAFGGGGAELQTSLIAKELAKDKDFDVNFLVLDWGQPKREKIDNVNLIAAYRRGRNFLNLFKAPVQLFLALLKVNPDVVVCRAAGVEIGISAVYARLFGKKLFYSLAAVMDLNGEAFKGFRGKIFRFGLFNSQVLVAQSADQLAMLQKYPALFKKPVALIKNSYVLSDEIISSEKKSVLWVGRCSPEKQPEIFLELAKKFPQEKFVMIAPKNKPLLWEKISAQAKDIKNLEFIEKVPFKDIGVYFQQAKVLVNTSSSEGFPNTFLQAAENGVAILSLNADPDAFLSAGGCGVACAGNIEKLESSLQNLLKGEDERSRLAANTLAYLRKNHNIEDNIKEWKILLKKILL